MRFRKIREIKKKIIVIVCSFSFIFFFSSTIYANWNILKRVQTRNSQRHYLLFDTSNGKNIEICFMLKQKENGVFSKKLLIYRVDKNDIHTISKEKAYKGLRIKKGRWIRWVISDGENPSKELEEFINGKEAVFQFYRDDGKIMETVFLLEGIKEAVEQILN